MCQLSLTTLRHTLPPYPPTSLLPPPSYSLSYFPPITFFFSSCSLFLIVFPRFVQILSIFSLIFGYILFHFSLMIHSPCHKFPPGDNLDQADDNCPLFSPFLYSSLAANTDFSQCTTYLQENTTSKWSWRILFLSLPPRHSAWLIIETNYSYPCPA